jgi:hypothetical protein
MSIQAAVTRRAILVVVLNLITALVFGFIGHQAFAQTAKAQATGDVYVEFLIGDRTEETRKWGHVSLRVVGAGSERIFDFGRYGKMWGRKDSAEGDPMLRVWKPGQFGTYRQHHLKDGGTTKRFRFNSTPERNARILSFFAHMTDGAPVFGSNAQFTMYKANYPTFHAVTVNCTTVSIDAFMKGFPEYNLNDTQFAEARSLQWYMRGEAQGFIYDQSEGHWTRIWWPLDLMALLETNYAAKGLVQVSPL